jgi:hypothetical protein
MAVYSTTRALMSGRARLPGGEPRKASQRKTRRAGPLPTRIMPMWQPGDHVRWKGRDGIFRCEIVEHSEIVVGERVYRVPTQDLTK